MTRRAVLAAIVLAGCSNSFDREVGMTLEPASVPVDTSTTVRVEFDRSIFNLFDASDVFLAVEVRGKGNVDDEDLVGAQTLFPVTSEPDLHEELFVDRPNAVVGAVIDRNQLNVDLQIPSEYAGSTLLLVIDSTYFDVHGTQRYYGIAEVSVTD